MTHRLTSESLVFPHYYHLNLHKEIQRVCILLRLHFIYQACSPHTMSSLLITRSVSQSIISRSTTIKQNLLSVRSASVKVDQTRRENHPEKEHKDEHKTYANKSTLVRDKFEHEAKKPDPQPEPSRSTGIEPHGPDGVKAGTGGR